LVTAKRKRSWLLFVWVFVAFAILVVNYALPILVAPYIYLGNAAPVASDAIYAPSLSLSFSPAENIKLHALDVPSALRAAGSAQMANKNTLAKVSVDEPDILQYTNGGEPIMRINYRYNMTGVDFGLQHYPDLALHVEGSCTTEYGWHYNTTRDSSGNILDEYHLFNDPNQQQSVSLYNSSMPLAYFFVNVVAGPPSNITWGAIVSSVGRPSYTASADPWYQTVPAVGNGNLPNYIVKAARPALSCWQNDVYSYRGHNSSIVGLTSAELPGLNMSEGLQLMLVRYLGVPTIVTFAGHLGGSVLQSAASSSTSPFGIFDAGSSRVYDDLNRLVLVAYIASANSLMNTVLYPMDVGNIPNFALESDGTVAPGIDEFVIFSNEVRTLSVSAITVIPVIFLALFVINYCLINLPSPWYRIQAVQATVLYTSLHQLAANNPGSVWRPEGGPPYIEKGDMEQSAVRPHYNKHTRTLNWEPIGSIDSGTTPLPTNDKREAVEGIVEGVFTPAEEVK
jgi:hypothetical protein